MQGDVFLMLLEEFTRRRGQIADQMLEPAIEQRIEFLEWAIQAMLEKLSDREGGATSG